MLRGSTADLCDSASSYNGLCEGSGSDYWILGPYQQIGRGAGDCGRRELDVDSLEEWWLMETRCAGDPHDGVRWGYAYIENTGGEGQFGNSGELEDDFRPRRYGCAPGAGGLCGDAGNAEGPASKPMFRKLYGTLVNQADVRYLAIDGDVTVSEPLAKTQLRIYGDVLYPTAMAYVGGMINAFVHEVAEPIDPPGPEGLRDLRPPASPGGPGLVPPGPAGPPGPPGQSGVVPGALLLLTGDDQPPSGYTLFATYTEIMDLNPGQKRRRLRPVLVRVYRRSPLEAPSETGAGRPAGGRPAP
jgi:hypothetical protein